MGRQSRAVPKNPQTADQQDHRRNVPAVTRRWSTLTLDQCAAWRSLAANTYFMTETGTRCDATDTSYL